MSASTEDLRNMILSFRVSELSDLLGFAGRNKTGKKQELQTRALDLLKLHSPPVQVKIHELHQRRFNTGIMGSNTMQDSMVQPAKMPMAPTNDELPPGMGMRSHMNHSLNFRSNMNFAGPSQGKPAALPLQSLNTKSNYPIHPDVQLKPLPFYDILSILIKPSSLIPDPNVTFQENTFEFTLSPQQVADINMSKCYNNTSNNAAMQPDYGNQIQLRFCLLETSCEQDDNFPPSILVKVNGKMVPLPAPIPTNRPGVAPKRPSRPVNITGLSKLSPMNKNLITVSWASEYPRPYVMAVYLVKKLDSKTLMSRLRTKGMRNPDHTRAMIKEKLTPSPDSEIATTSLRGSLLCPIGKNKMTEPCRSLTCTHLQCFDADLFIKMNEKKPRWICPVCDKPAPFNSLAIDGLFSEISAKAPSTCNEVQFHEDGSWTPIISDKEFKDTFSVVDGIQSSHIVSPVKKKAKKDTIEVVTLDSDSDEDWSSSSSIAPQTVFKSADIKIPSTSYMYGAKVSANSQDPFISLPSPSSPFDSMEPSPLPAVPGNNSQNPSQAAFVPLSGPSPSLIKPPSSTSVPMVRGKDGELDSHYGMSETPNSLPGGYQDMAFTPATTYPSYFSSVASSSPRDPNTQGYSGNDSDSFDLYSLLQPEMDPQIARSTSSDKTPDVISID